MVGRLLVAAAPTVLLAPDTANADDVLATLPSLQQSPFSRLSAYAGQVVWSERVSSDGYVLRRWRAGGVDRLPVRPRMVPFDLDLGPDAGGRAVAAVQEGFADVPHSPNVTPDETTWVRDVSTPCLATRSSSIATVSGA